MHPNFAWLESLDVGKPISVAEATCRSSRIACVSSPGLRVCRSDAALEADGSERPGPATRGG